MSFLPLYNIAKFKDNTDSPKFGTVINNEDPKQLGRIRVAVVGMFESEDEKGSNLPWIPRLQDNFLCGTNKEVFSVPKKGDIVEIVWPYDKNTPFYKSIPYTEKSKTSNFSEDYPNSWGIAGDEFLLKVNAKKKELTIKFGNALIEIDTDGNINISGKDINIKGDSNINIKGDSNININSGATVKISGNTTVENRVFLNHKHYSGDSTTGGVV